MCSGLARALGAASRLCLFNCFLFDPVILFEADDVFDTLARGNELRLFEPRVIAGLLELHHRLAHEVLRDTDRYRRVYGSGVSHVLELSKAVERSAVASTAAL